MSNETDDGLPPINRRSRSLTDDDVDAIVAALQTAVISQFYADLGKGVWAMVKKGIFVALMVVAAWGSIKGMK